MMKKLLFSLLLIALGITAMAQQSIQLRSTSKAECVKSDMTSLKASFSFSTIEAQDYESERGTFSWLSLPNTVLGGNVGDPQIPVVNQLIAVPFGATPRIEITSYSTTDYRLADYDMKTLVPRQLPVRKSQNPDEVPFIMNEAAYQTRGFRSEPLATVSVDGTMRGIQLGTMTIEPISYDPVNNTIRVFNDIEVTVRFDGADVQATEDMLLKTYSPAFDAVYSQLFNSKAITDVYTDHPDLYNTPVRMLVICYSGFQGNSALNSWLEWKLQKGYYVDIFYTSETGTSASAIASFIKTKYNASVSAGNAYTYLIVIGDTGQVPQYMTKNIDSDIGQCASDLGYASVNFSSSTSNYFPDMYYSRMSVENTTQLATYINKVLTYEKYEFTDGGNYLNNVLLVGGWDSSWTSRVAKPTINYGSNNYFNTTNTTYGGFSGGTIHAVVSTSTSQGYSSSNHGVYNGINDGACIVNYTAHGDKQEWQVPQFTAAQAATLTNTGKYFFCIGNCCLTGNFNNTTTSYSPGSTIGTTASFGETMIRVPNAGAIAYVGCSPYSYWYEDFYWAVGAHSYSQGNAPSVSSSTKGVYDVMFMDQYWNSASALLYLGNLAVQQAVTNNNTNSSVTDGNCNNSAHYYFQFYHTFGDGSVMPYITKPETNAVSIPSIVTPGTTSINVNALAGSYVAVTDNSSVIYGVAEANSQGVATVNFTNEIPASGTLYVVVTRQQYQPYFGTISVVGGTQYDITVNQPQHGTISAPAQAYANTTVTLEASPETGYCLSGWTVKNANNQNITVTNNQFTMPESNVTVTATFVPGMQVTLASVMNGTISADPLYALQGDIINLTATPATGYNLDSWIVYKTGDVNTTVPVNGNSFTMPNYPVTVSAVFSKPAGGDVTIGSGTTTTNGNNLPTNVYYKYSLSQQIYTAAELGEAGTITAISFYYNSSTSSGSRTLDIYMSHTSSSTISSWVTESTSNLVYSGSHTFTQGWNTITLTTPFVYNGTSNLLLTFDDNTNNYDVSTSQYFYTYSTGSNRAIYYRNDSNNPPATSSNTYSASSLQYNAQMKITKEVPSAEGYLSVSPTSLSGFNAIAGEASEPQSVSVIGNNLQTNLTVTAPSGYEVSTTQNGTYNSTLTLTPSNGSVRSNVYVRLNSYTPGTCNGNLTLTSGTTTATVALSGTVIPGSGEQYTISVNASPAVGGNVTGAGTYYENVTCTLTATPNEHYTFSGWQLDGSVVSTSASYSFAVTGNANYTALFTLMPQYNVSIVQVEGGTITADVATAYPGDVVNLSVTTNNGYFFVEWDVKDANNQIVTVNGNQFTMPESDVTVTAVFTQGFTLSLEQTANGTISASQTTGLQPGAQVTLTATPDNGCVFLAWYAYKTGNPRDVVSVISNQYILMPSSDVTVQAIFVTEEEHEENLGSGTTANAYIPTYVRRAYSLTQQIYLASELNNQKGRITKIAYRATTTASTRNLTIYMAHTDLSSFSSTTDWEVMGSVAKVFEGSVAFSTSDWTTITLDTPFEYDGTSNINICVVDNTGSTAGSNSRYTQFYRYSGTNRALYVNGSSSYANTVGYSNQLSSTTGTRISYVNQIHITMMVPGSAESLTLSPGEINDFSYVEGQGPSANNKFSVVGVDLSNDITVTAPTNFEISLTEDGTYASSLTIPRETGSKGSRTVTSWGFEDGLEGWTAVDSDNDGYGWVLGSACGGVYLEEGSSLTDGHTGTGLVVSGSYTNVSGDALTPDNWLISPQIDQLGGSFSMWAKAQQAAYPAEHFGIYVSTTGTNPSDFTLLDEWTLTSANWKQFSVDLGLYTGQTGYIAVRHFSCTDQFILNVDDFELDTEATITIEMPVTITPATVYVRMKENLNVGEYSGTLTASAGSGDNLSGSVSLSGEVTEPEQPEQQVILSQGWSWWSTNLDISLNDLETALGNYGITISSPNGTVSYLEGLGWDGNLNTLDLSMMYEINVSQEVEFTLSASPVNPAEVPVTINQNGWSWIGYPVQQSMSVSEALANLTPAPGDIVKSKNQMAVWGGSSWLNDFTMEPGQGFKYRSYASSDKTFYYPTNGEGGAKANMTNEDNYWTPESSRFANNMNVLAVVEIDEAEAFNDGIEIGAFAGNECRGSMRLQLVPELGRYIAFMTIHGEANEPISFRILDGDIQREVKEEIVFSTDALVGDLQHPFVLHANGNSLSIFPNPVDKGQAFSMEIPADIELNGARVEVFNALGTKVRTETLSGTRSSMAGLPTAGIYTIKITDRNGITHFVKLVVK
jgi:gingipain K